MRAATDPAIKAPSVSKCSAITGTHCPFPVRRLEGETMRAATDPIIKATGVKFYGTEVHALKTSAPRWPKGKWW